MYFQNNFQSYSTLSMSTDYFIKPMSLNNLTDEYFKPISNSYTHNSFKTIYKKGNEIKEDDFSYKENEIISNTNVEDLFIIPTKEKNTTFVNMSSQIIDEVQRAIKIITDDFLPKDLEIKICNKVNIIEAFRKYNPNELYTDSIRGFALNSNDKKEIYVVEDIIQKLIITLGHEIGHIMTPKRINTVTEEAKAYAFQLVFLKTVIDNNILNLRNKITLEHIGKPAINGIHNVAFSWINSFLMDGYTSKEIYEQIISGELIIWDS